MLGKTHMVCGCTTALVTSMALNKLGLYDAGLISESIFVGSAIAGSVLPDIDKKGSIVSSRYKIVSAISRLFFTHRGFTHSVLCLILCSAILYLTTRFIPFNVGDSVLLGFIVGFASHLIADSFNPMGIPIFFPIKQKFSFGKIRTGGFWEKFVFAGCLVITVVLAGNKIYFELSNLPYLTELLSYAKATLMSLI